jgi:hypothetical protein
MTQTTMTGTPLDTLGPVDYVVVEFPAGASSFTGEMARELVALVEAGTIRVIDALILVKDEGGSVEAMELSDVQDLGPLRRSRLSSRSCWPPKTSTIWPRPWSRAAQPGC